MNFVDELKNRPVSFYITLGLSGVVSYSIYKASPTPIGIATGTVSSSLIQYYAFNYLKAEEAPISGPSTPDETSTQEVSQWDSYFQ